MSCFCEVEADHIKEQPHIVPSPGASQDGGGELQGCSCVEECWKPKCETLGDLWAAFWPQVKWFCLRCDFHCVLLPPLGKCQRSCKNWPLKLLFSRQKKSDKAWTEVSLLPACSLRDTALWYLWGLWGFHALVAGCGHGPLLYTATCQK